MPQFHPPVHALPAGGERVGCGQSLTRRAFLLNFAALLGAPALARATALSGEQVRLAAAWQVGDSYRVGILQAGANLKIAAELVVPTRAHGLLREPSGTLLAVARRPGDWLARWDEQGRPLTWRWIEPGRAFAGHMLASPDGSTVYTTETDLETGAGLLGIRDGATLAKLAERPTHGIDPHQLLWDVTRPGALIVANGGVPTRPETGRRKHDLGRMDSSLVRLDGASGELLGQWRLDDPRLSLRHLAWNGDRLGIALQAEHDDPQARQRAPVLAILEHDCLRSVAGPEFEGYGGSIVASGDGFAVSCPRAQGVARYDVGRYDMGRYDVAGYCDFLPLAEACPLAAAGTRVWAGGRDRLIDPTGLPLALPAADMRLDNHWIAL